MIQGCKEKPKLRKLRTCGNCKFEEFGYLSSPYNHQCHFHECDFNELLEDGELAWEHVCDEWSAKDE